MFLQIIQIYKQQRRSSQPMSIINYCYRTKEQAMNTMDSYLHLTDVLHVINILCFISILASTSAKLLLHCYGL